MIPTSPKQTSPCGAELGGIYTKPTQGESVAQPRVCREVTNSRGGQKRRGGGGGEGGSVGEWDGVRLAKGLSL